MAGMAGSMDVIGDSSKLAFDSYIDFFFFFSSFMQNLGQICSCV